MRLVDDLLDVSRITRGKVALQKAPVALAAVVDAAVETVRPLLEQRGQTLEVQVPSGIWLDADKARLSQVFANILHNAAKFSRPEGRIEVSAQEAPEGVTITIRDHGIGIPPEQLGSIFDMFSQGDSSVERAEGGLGLGLTIVKNLLDLHGGRIEAASQGLGTGAAFSVHLPTRAGNPTTPGEGARPARADAAGLRLLVVDDNRDSADSLGAMLRLLGHEVQLQYDGASALELARQFRPQVVFLDIGMPGMNGFDVCRRLRARWPADELVVVAQTGWGDEAQRARAKEAGFDHHLVKPVDPAAVQGLLASIARNLR